MPGSSQPDIRVTGFRLFVQQTWALVWKNVLLSWRSPRATSLQLLSSLFFIFLVWVIDRAIQDARSDNTGFRDLRNPVPAPAKQIPLCTDMWFRDTSKNCYTLTYSPRGPVTDRIVAAIAANNDPVIPSEQVRGFASYREVDDFMLAYPQTVQAAVQFYVEGATRINYGLQTNSTGVFFRGVFQDKNLDVQVPIQVALEREVTRHLAGNASLGWDVSTVEFAHPAFDTFSIVGAILPMFLFAAVMFGFVVQLSAIVAERENKLRQAMRTMGLKQSAYWLSWALWEMVLSFISSILIIIFGLIFRFSLFRDNSFGLLFFLFFLFQMAMSSIAFCLASVVRKSSTATTVGFFVYILGFILQLVVAFGFPYNDQYDGYWRIIISFIPPALLAKGLNDLGEATSVSTYGGIDWQDRDTYCLRNPPFGDGCLFTLANCYRWLIGTWLGYFVAAIYLDNVMPDENGIRRPFYFCLTPRFWSRNGGSTAVQGGNCCSCLTNCFQKTMPEPPESEKDVDVAAEEERVKFGGDMAAATIQVRGLHKSFGKYRALKENWFSIESGQVFCLLGPNGAGKTTLFNCLTGIIPSTGGDAVVCGESITAPGGLDKIRNFMGVCPQFDLLWDSLTGPEHLMLFARLKGLPPHRQASETARLLEQVKLTSARKVQTVAFSGGMKRRLSVAIALIGNPRVLYLDEPTTGMDPIARRHVWDTIEQSKEGRAIILTTHSMEEADILGDTISILAKGRLRCLGSSIRLKSRFGAGYRLHLLSADTAAMARTATISLRLAAASGGGGASSSAARLASVTGFAQATEDLRAYVKMKYHLVPVGDMSATHTEYIISKKEESQMQAILSDLQAQSERFRIGDMQLSLTTLDEVFLRISREAELEHARAQGLTTPLWVDELAATVKVPVGAETVPVSTLVTARPNQPPDHRVLHLVWDQDEAGALCISSHYLE
eukprot:jgi/Mesvir1/27989/Mv20188-RA.1